MRFGAGRHQIQIGVGRGIDVEMIRRLRRRRHLRDIWLRLWVDCAQPDNANIKTAATINAANTRLRELIVFTSFNSTVSGLRSRTISDPSAHIHLRDQDEKVPNQLRHGSHPGHALVVHRGYKEDVTTSNNCAS